MKINQLHEGIEELPDKDEFGSFMDVSEMEIGAQGAYTGSGNLALGVDGKLYMTTHSIVQFGNVIYNRYHIQFEKLSPTRGRIKSFVLTTPEHTRRTDYAKSKLVEYEVVIIDGDIRDMPVDCASSEEDKEFFYRINSFYGA